MEFPIHDEMDMAKITLKELLSSALFFPTFLVMPYWRNTKDRRKGGGQINQPHSLDESMSTHNQEEADIMIPLM